MFTDEYARKFEKTPEKKENVGMKQNIHLFGEQSENQNSHQNEPFVDYEKIIRDEIKHDYTRN